MEDRFDYVSFLPVSPWWINFSLFKMLANRPPNAAAAFMNQQTWQSWADRRLQTAADWLIKYGQLVLFIVKRIAALWFIGLRRLRECRWPACFKIVSAAMIYWLITRGRWRHTCLGRFHVCVFRDRLASTQRHYWIPAPPVDHSFPPAGLFPVSAAHLLPESF